jgi:hypothetical protein
MWWRYCRGNSDMNWVTWGGMLCNPWTFTILCHFLTREVAIAHSFLLNQAQIPHLIYEIFPLSSPLLLIQTYPSAFSREASLLSSLKLKLQSNLRKKIFRGTIINSVKFLGNLGKQHSRYL